MKKRTILFFILLIAASLLLFIYTFSILAHTPERTGTVSGIMSERNKKA